jgi:hypothetical protein
MSMQCTSTDLEDLTWFGDLPVLDEPHAWLLRLSWERRLAELQRGW